MGLFSGLKKIVGAGARGIGGIVKKTIKKVKKAANFVAKKFKGFASELGPLGTIALIGAAIYFTGPAGAGLLSAVSPAQLPARSQITNCSLAANGAAVSQVRS